MEHCDVDWLVNFNVSQCDVNSNVNVQSVAFKT